MKLSVQLVAWNGAKYMSYLFESLRNQTFKDWNLYVLNNASTDNTAEMVKKELNNFSIQSEFIESKENLGFAAGHNFIFKNTDSEYSLFLNQDMYLMHDCLEQLVRFMDGHANAGAASPRLMKWNFSKLESQNLMLSFSGRIDSLGMKVYRSRRVVEQYAQEDWNKIFGRFGQTFMVFGVSGALPMFRRSAAIQTADENGDLFDGSYHSYKEDVDLAYRMAAGGYKSYIVLDAVAYHDRSAAGPKELNDQKAAENKKLQSEWIKYNSYKNHLITLYKNEYWQNFCLDFPWILWYELKKFVYFLLSDRKILAGLKEIWKNRRDLSAKRKSAIKLRRIDWKKMRENLAL